MLNSTATERPTIQEVLNNAYFDSVKEKESILTKSDFYTDSWSKYLREVVDDLIQRSNVYQLQ